MSRLSDCELLHAKDNLVFDPEKETSQIRTVNNFGFCNGCYEGNSTKEVGLSRMCYTRDSNFIKIKWEKSVL